MINDYIFGVSDCIDSKFIDFAMTEAKSIYNIELLYHHYLVDVSKLFCNPKEHYSKIMVLAYRKTIEEMRK